MIGKCLEARISPFWIRYQGSITVWSRNNLLRYLNYTSPSNIEELGLWEVELRTKEESKLHLRLLGKQGFSNSRWIQVLLQGLRIEL